MDAFRVFRVLVSVIALIPAGCCTQGQKTETDYLRPVSFAGLRLGDLVRFQQEISMLEANLQLVRDPETKTEVFERALAAVERGPVLEKPELWVEIANDPRYCRDHRRDCLVALFRRHIRPGTRLNEIHRLHGTQDWFRADNLFKVTIAASLPIRNRGECVYMYQPEVLRGVSGKYGPNGAVYFSLTKYFSEAELPLVLSGQKGDGCARIIEISGSPGPLNSKKSR
jgi:hypothetical protein